MLKKLLVLYISIGVVNAATCFSAAHTTALRNDGYDLFWKIGPRHFLKKFVCCTLDWPIEVPWSVYDTVVSIYNNRKEGV